MKKFSLILDSSSGITMKEANKRNVGFIPLKIIIDNKEFKSGVDITSEEICKIMLNKPTVATSLPSGEDIINAFDKALEIGEKAIYLSMSYKFSGTNNSAKIIAQMKKYKDKIFVFNSEYSSPWIGLHSKKIQEIVENGESVEKIYKILEFQNPFMKGYLSPGDIYWFYKGGRITKTQYTIANLLKIKPILTVKNGEIDKNKVEKARNIEKAIYKMCEYIKSDIEILKEKKLKYKIISLISENENLNNEVLELISKNMNVDKKNIIKTYISAEQTAHMGPTSFGLSTLVEFKELK